ncbi:hypothetical protein EDAG_05508 [Enterococcus faecium D344SRF]|nr:hypothetical protein EDAG_05508 [Enterococcus faecium D344SRF]
MDIYLKKAILHIIDRETGSPVFSQKELDLTKEYIRDFLQKKIQKNLFCSNKNWTTSRRKHDR